MNEENLIQSYRNLLEAGKIKHYSEKISDIIGEVFETSLKILDKSKSIDLISKVKGKEYFAYEYNKKRSRAINIALFTSDYNEWLVFRNCLENDNIEDLEKERLSKILYSIAISFCATIDVIDNGGRKTSATFFEYFVAYLFSWRLGIEPQTSIQLLTLDEEKTKLPTDYIFDMGNKKPKFHLPIKTSTRERSIMLWAHQKLLDGVYGIERFIGTPVILNELKTSKAKKEVVEICLPEQWRLYQLYIAQLRRIYYFDLPASYEGLSDIFPPIKVKPFSEFFYEWEDVMNE